MKNCCLYLNISVKNLRKTGEIKKKERKEKNSHSVITTTVDLN